MPTALPSEATASLKPPDAAEVAHLSQGIVSAVAPPEGLTPTQQLLLEAVVQAMTGHPAGLERASLKGNGLSASAFAEAMGSRNLAFRSRIVQIMVLLALILRPLPRDVVERVESFASELCVEEGMLRVAERFAEGSLGLAALDFDRNGYTAEWDPRAVRTLHVTTDLDTPWEFDVADAALASRWKSLERLPGGTLGRRMADFYRSRGFVYPGLPGSAPPLLTQHDWVHVLTDFGTTVESELEVFAFIARANDDLRAFSLLAMVVSLFETGYLRAGAGLFESAPGHLSRAGMSTRIADAMRRGALCTGSVDFMALDWFALADAPVEQVRRHFGIVEKSPEAVVAGSVGPWEPGGISAFQIGAGTALAEQEGRPYESFGAAVATR